MPRSTAIGVPKIAVVRRLVLPLLAICAVCAACASTASAVGDPFPANIQNIQMGSSMNSVMDMIKGSGTHEVQPNPQSHRPILVWLLPDNPYYDKLSFRFTEKDRLYLIRFDLKGIAQRDLRALKKPLFQKYGISWDDPWKLKVKDDDILLYGPPNLGTIYYFEFTNLKTAAKAMELMHRTISSEDRPAKQEDKKQLEGDKIPDVLQKAVQPADQETKTETASPEKPPQSSETKSEDESKVLPK